MQFLIFLSLFTSAFAGGEFQSKIKAHSDAVAAVKLQIKLAGDAQLKFKKIMETCEPKNISSQDTLLTCAQKLLQLNLEIQHLSNTQAEARKRASNLSPEFAVSAASLASALDESDKILELTTSVPKRLSDSFFSMNAVYVKKQFDLKYRDSFNTMKLKTFCSELQAEINSLAQIGQFANDANLPFSTIYKQQLRIRNILVLAGAIAPTCKNSYDLRSLNSVYLALGKKITPATFVSFKTSVCAKPKPESKLDMTTCNNLPLTPYSIQWLDLARGVK